MSEGDAAYATSDLQSLPSGVTWTTRSRSNAAFFDLCPPRTHKAGRPRLRGSRLPSLASLATTLAWTTTSLCRYGTTATVHIAQRQL